MSSVYLCIQSVGKINLSVQFYFCCFCFAVFCLGSHWSVISYQYLETECLLLNKNRQWPWQKLNAFESFEDRWVKIKEKIRMRRKDDFKPLQTWFGCWCQTGWSEFCCLLFKWNFCTGTTVSGIYSELSRKDRTSGELKSTKVVAQNTLAVASGRQSQRFS